MRGAFSFPQASGRAQALGEIHARPLRPLGPSRVVFQLAFMSESGSAAGSTMVSDMARQRGVPPPDDSTNHVALAWGQGTLRWERHTEFSTYSWDCPAPDTFFAPVGAHPFGAEFAPPGPFLSGARVEVRPEDEDIDKAIAMFDPVSLTISDLKAARATVVTDFRQDEDGLTRFLIIDRGMSDAMRGVICQRLLDIETYRTLATLGLELARQLSPDIARLEEQLTAVTHRMKEDVRHHADDLLREITRMSAELEANAALSLYRFGASRAYYTIVRERIAALGESGVPGREMLGAFLDRRLAPALRTCQAVEERQANLSRKMARATTLIRSWIDVELEKQNGALLRSMNRRVKLQLRMQQTVEGLSVAAISYYVVGLFSYLAKLQEATFGWPETSLATGAFVPVAIFGTWWVVRAIRRHHPVSDEDTD
ncbi:DUF3422 family protein [Pseudohoeflea coraliihabitans]|uniref:DUF3422 family protein n=1 Tax=Pseudohoeflea coraliihabitans TaxID=2860393 RepID=A0ABS6WPS6_9HYPH|nr:DUF3422 family protein [Pseudohoeflea sp. DP4N28-3]MBW3097915.1 DUF3422 family protein [Pseudohoeflea sp. DP4N28-3]